MLGQLREQISISHPCWTQAICVGLYTDVRLLPYWEWATVWCFRRQSVSHHIENIISSPTDRLGQMTLWYSLLVPRLHAVKVLGSNPWNFHTSLVCSGYSGNRGTHPRTLLARCYPKQHWSSLWSFLQLSREVRIAVLLHSPPLFFRTLWSPSEILTCCPRSTYIFDIQVVLEMLL